jgi:hypothetical protein
MPAQGIPTIELLSTPPRKSVLQGSATGKDFSAGMSGAFVSRTVPLSCEAFATLRANKLLLIWSDVFSHVDFEIIVAREFGVALGTLE